MSDFDEVLERLVSDPEFQAALRRDPVSALRGYQLAPDERQLLDAQLDLGTGAERTVEMRVSKSGVFGMVGPMVSGLGLVGTPETPGSGVFGAPRQDEGTFGPAPVTQTFGTVEPQAVFGTVGADAGQPAADYHTSVDADGDGSWDSYQAVERGDGGVDIRVDTDGDGTVDFVGHDYDRDGLVDTADVDRDGDGALDTRLYDDNEDGWMDRETPMPTSDQATFGQAPASG
jgi:hypothetical protein